MMQQLKHEYSDGIHHKKVAVLGNYPPPLGGVSVHIARVMHKLRNQGNRVYHFDTSKRGNVLVYVLRLFVFLFTRRCDIIYYHTVDLNRRFIELKLLLMIKKMLRYDLVLVEHSCRHLAGRTTASKITFNRYIQGVDKLVLIGHSTWQSYIDHHICTPNNTTVEAAFLPPDMLLESKIIETYPISLQEFLKNHSPIIIINAFQLSFVEGKDLYGIDLTIDVLIRLSKEYSTIGFLYVFAQIGDQEYFISLKSRLERSGLSGLVYFLIGQQELWPLLKNVDLFVRPTRSDGESVSVQEALYFKVPVVASNACKRPDGVVVFQSGDAEGFYQKINQVLGKSIKGSVYAGSHR